MMESASFQMSGGMGQEPVAGSSTYTLRGGIVVIGDAEPMTVSVPSSAPASAASSAPAAQPKPVQQKGNAPAKAGAPKAAPAGPKPPARVPAAKPAAPAAKPTDAAKKPTAPLNAPAQQPQAPKPVTAAPAKTAEPQRPRLSVETLHQKREERKQDRVLGIKKGKTLDAIRNRKRLRAHLPAAVQLIVAAVERRAALRTSEGAAAPAASLLSAGTAGAGLTGLALGGGMGAAGIALLHAARRGRQRTRRARRSAGGAFWLCLLCMAGGMLAPALAAVHAEQSAPRRFAYNGRLLQSGSPVTSPHAIRFSYWKSPNAVAGDLAGNGSINTASAAYADWQETFTVTPDAQGYFSVELGSTEQLPDMGTLSFGTLLSLYLQVEVKPASAAATAFELMDPNPTNDAVDRTGMLSVPFALNADMVDRRGVGTGSGSIPLLGPGGVLPASVIPVTLPADAFTVDSDDSAAAPALRFGTSLNESLTFDTALSRFSFSDDLHVAGNISLTGTVNGVDIAALAATVASGSVVRHTLHPAFAGALVEGDGTANVGRLSVEQEPTSGNPAYRWQSSRSTLQDYDISVRFTLPPTFSAWEAAPLAVSYKTTNGTAAHNAVQVRVFDTDGNETTLSGTSTLADSDWTTAERGFAGSPTWEAGTDIELRFTLKAKNGNDAWLGAVELRYRKE